MLAEVKSPILSWRESKAQTRRKRSWHSLLWGLLDLLLKRWQRRPDNRQGVSARGLKYMCCLRLPAYAGVIWYLLSGTCVAALSGPLCCLMLAVPCPDDWYLESLGLDQRSIGPHAVGDHGVPGERWHAYEPRHGRVLCRKDGCNPACKSTRLLFLLFGFGSSLGSFGAPLLSSVSCGFKVTKCWARSGMKCCPYEILLDSSTMDILSPIGNLSLNRTTRCVCMNAHNMPMDINIHTHTCFHMNITGTYYMHIYIHVLIFRSGWYQRKEPCKLICLKMLRENLYFGILWWPSGSETFAYM